MISLRFRIQCFLPTEENACSGFLYKFSFQFGISIVHISYTFTLKCHTHINDACVTVWCILPSIDGGSFLTQATHPYILQELQAIVYHAVIVMEGYLSVE